MADLAVNTPTAPSPPQSVPAASRVGRPALWQWLWAPFWLGSEVPVFTPGPEPVVSRELGPAGDVVIDGLDRLRRRLWLRHSVHLVLRAVWLTLAVGCIWQVVDLLGGPAIEWQILLWLGGGLVGLSLVFAVLNRPDRVHVARMLDRTFGLRDRLMTALEHLGHRGPRPGEQASIMYLQLADAANVITEVRQQPALRFAPPVREMVPALGFALLLTALVFLRGTGDNVPPVAVASVPRFTPAVARTAAPEQAPLSPENTALAPTVDEVMEQSRRSTAAQQDLQHLATALADHAVTAPAAAAITEGNYDAARDRLREFAPQAGQLSPAAREGLARDLDQAAGAMSPDNGELQEATEQAAAGLREGGEEATRSVEALGDEVAETGSRVASQQELADQMQRAQESERRQQVMANRPPTDSGSQDQQSQAANRSESGEDGESNESGDSGQEGSEEGGEAAPGDDDAENAAQAGDRGEGGANNAQMPGETMSGQGGDPGQGDEAGTALDIQSLESDESSQGNGAASGDSGNDEGGEEQRRRSNSRNRRDPRPGEAEQRVTNASGERVQADAPNATENQIGLSGGPGADGMQTVNNAGGTVRGSGAGITAGSGSATQADVAEAGPDSNRVPEEYRPVVERYFSNLDDN